MGSLPHVVSWLLKEGQGEEMEKKAVPEAEVTVQGHLVTYQSPESALEPFHVEGLTPNSPFTFLVF